MEDRLPSVFLNAGHGDVLTETGLIRALVEKCISGEVLDIFPVKPLRESSPLWARPEMSLDHLM